MKKLKYDLENEYLHNLNIDYVYDLCVAEYGIPHDGGTVLVEAVPNILSEDTFFKRQCLDLYKKEFKNSLMFVDDMFHFSEIGWSWNSIVETKLWNIDRVQKYITLLFAMNLMEVVETPNIREKIGDFLYDSFNENGNFPFIKSLGISFKNVDELPWKQSLKQWKGENTPHDSLIYKDGYWNQINFITDSYVDIFPPLENWDELEQILLVIGSHTSKSVELPVYYFKFKGCEFILRYNFFDWKVSISSEQKLDIPFNLIGNKGEDISNCYFEGFKQDWIYEGYVHNQKQFSIEVGNNERLYTLLYLIKNQL